MPHLENLILIYPYDWNLYFTPKNLCFMNSSWWLVNKIEYVPVHTAQNTYTQ